MATTTKPRPKHINFWEELRLARERKGLTISEAARQLGITRPTWYSWAGDFSHKPPSPEYAEVVARFIDRPVREVLAELYRADAARQFGGRYDIEVKVRPKSGGGSLTESLEGDFFRGSSPSPFSSLPRPHHGPRLDVATLHEIHAHLADPDLARDAQCGLVLSA